MFESVKMGLLKRLRQYFSGAGRQQVHVEDQFSPEQRGFDRYAMSFPVVVSGNDFTQTPFEEKSRLQDVSGNGAMFLTRFPDRYYSGQFLQLSIMLDAADDVQARISNEATVVRIHQLSSESLDPSMQTGIAVKFHYAFDFERIDSGHGGSSG